MALVNAAYRAVAFTGSAPNPNRERHYIGLRGRVEELLVAKELWNDHKKPFFFPFSSAATYTNHSLEVDKR
ncbi:hypothetical protein Taro_035303 [Colocasia esculenta]|uniref:Uncharacterized protein n=1 Tax=Colocasia esculenta TaxID=4460 RepID=A0A843WEH9_COLES|nr:hypothetical protein [Colocasia esculenta]